MKLAFVARKVNLQVLSSPRGHFSIYCRCLYMYMNLVKQRGFNTERDSSTKERSLKIYRYNGGVVVSVARRGKLDEAPHAGLMAAVQVCSRGGIKPTVEILGGRT